MVTLRINFRITFNNSERNLNPSRYISALFSCGMNSHCHCKGVQNYWNWRRAKLKIICGLCFVRNFPPWTVQVSKSEVMTHKTCTSASWGFCRISEGQLVNPAATPGKILYSNSHHIPWHLPSNYTQSLFTQLRINMAQLTVGTYRELDSNQETTEIAVPRQNEIYCCGLKIWTGLIGSLHIYLCVIYAVQYKFVWISSEMASLLAGEGV